MAPGRPGVLELEPVAELLQVGHVAVGQDQPPGGDVEHDGPVADHGERRGVAVHGDRVDLVGDHRRLAGPDRRQPPRRGVEGGHRPAGSHRHAGAGAELGHGVADAAQDPVATDDAEVAADDRGDDATADGHVRRAGDVDHDRVDGRVGRVELGDGGPTAPRDQVRLTAVLVEGSCSSPSPT